MEEQIDIDSNSQRKEAVLSPEKELLQLDLFLNGEVGTSMLAVYKHLQQVVDLLNAPEELQLRRHTYIETSTHDSADGMSSRDYSYEVTQYGYEYGPPGNRRFIVVPKDDIRIMTDNQKRALLLRMWEPETRYIQSKLEEVTSSPIYIPEDARRRADEVGLQARAGRVRANEQHFRATLDTILRKRQGVLDSADGTTQGEAIALSKQIPEIDKTTVIGPASYVRNSSPPRFGHELTKEWRSIIPIKEKLERELGIHPEEEPPIREEETRNIIAAEIARTTDSIQALKKIQGLKLFFDGKGYVPRELDFASRDIYGKVSVSVGYGYATTAKDLATLEGVLEELQKLKSKYDSEAPEREAREKEERQRALEERKKQELERREKEPVEALFAVATHKRYEYGKPEGVEVDGQVGKVSVWLDKEDNLTGLMFESTLSVNDAPMNQDIVNGPAELQAEIATRWDPEANIEREYQRVIRIFNGRSLRDRYEYVVVKVGDKEMRVRLGTDKYGSVPHLRAVAEELESRLNTQYVGRPVENRQGRLTSHQEPSGLPEELPAERRPFTTDKEIIALSESELTAELNDKLWTIVRDPDTLRDVRDTLRKVTQNYRGYDKSKLSQLLALRAHIDALTAIQDLGLEEALGKDIVLFQVKFGSRVNSERQYPPPDARAAIAREVSEPFIRLRKDLMEIIKEEGIDYVLEDDPEKITEFSEKVLQVARGNGITNRTELQALAMSLL